MTKYMIVNLIKGEAAYYLKNISDELAHVFMLEEVSRRIAPHLTLKAPFEAREIESIAHLLKQFAEKRIATKLMIEGFGSFERRVIYMEIKPSSEAAAFITDLTNELRRSGKIRLGRFDSQATENKRLHATIAYAPTKETHEEIKKYLKDEKAKFDIMLDNIAILEKDGEKPWKLHSEFALGK